MSYVINGDYVYRIDGVVKSLVGNAEKIETERINNTTVIDITSQFDVDAGEYVERSRVEREDILPPPEPTAEERIEQLEVENENLKNMIEEKDRENKIALFEIYTMLLPGGG